MKTTACFPVKRPGKRRPSRSRGAKTDVYTLSEAKAILGRLVQKAEEGTAVFIVRGRSYFTLQRVPPLEPISVRPPGYFRFGADDIALDNHLASANVVPDPTVE